jgi:uncharacterized membrane protein
MSSGDQDMEAEMSIGPVEYLIVGFPENKFTGEIAPALAELIEARLVRVLDLVFIAKGDDGEVASFEFDQLDELAGFADVSGESRGLLNDEDLQHAAETLEPGTSAALLIWEDLWASKFADAVRNAGGVVLEGGRVPHELAETALAELAG